MRKSSAPPRDPFSAALRMLARRPYSVGELRRTLARKFPDSNEIPAALARLRELGFLDDRKFAERAAASLVRDRRFGRFRVRRELKAKLVDYRTIEPALDQAYESVNERELLEITLEKKIKRLKRPVTRARLASLCQSLIRRGFRADDIMKAIRQRPELVQIPDGVDTEDAQENK